ncbi:STX5 [Cordylochernes scorpioides]|uniref:STX5 n=1 Tax=Cordylochernes scorpioides TaxID=51811 RepID=A0ABY6LQ15_9ARAC|nr:STX5 [Cordylochernes scorpioides]
MSNDFRQVLEVRTENLKHQKNRREQFSQGALVASSLPPSALSGHHSGGSALMSMDHTAVDLGDSPTSPLLMRQDQLQLIDEQFIEKYISLQCPPTTGCVCAGCLYPEPGRYHAEHRSHHCGAGHHLPAAGPHGEGTGGGGAEVSSWIDANVEDTSLNVEAAHSEISRYFQSVTSNRWLMIKIFGVLIVFFIIFVVIAAA